MSFFLDFMFGKAPKIFDRDGTVRHDLPKEKWDNWNARYQQGAEYNWRNHTGMKSAGANKSHPAAEEMKMSEPPKPPGKT